MIPLLVELWTIIAETHPFLLVGALDALFGLLAVHSPACSLDTNISRINENQCVLWNEGFRHASPSGFSSATLAPSFLLGRVRTCSVGQVIGMHKRLRGIWLTLSYCGH